MEGSAKSSIEEEDLAVSPLLVKEDTSSFVWILTSVAALSGFLFGYDTSVVSSALVNIQSDLGSPLNDFKKEWIVTSCSVGALIGALFSSNAYVTQYGRKGVLGLGDLFFILGAVIISSSYSLGAMIVGRIILGFGVGIASSTAPLYIAELAPTFRRTSLITIQTVAITGGQLIAYCIGAGLTMRGGWRISFALSVVPAIIQAAFLKWLPESPKHDLSTGRVERARETFRRIYIHATESDIDLYQNEIQSAIKSTHQFQTSQSSMDSFKHLFKFRFQPTLIACGTMALQQFCGFNSLNYYSATIFSALSFDNPTAVGIIVAGTNFFFTCIALILFSKGVGKRNLLLVTIPGMIVGLALSAIAFHLIARTTGGILIPGSDYPISQTSFMLVSIVIFILSYALGIGNVAWNSVELFHLSVRDKGASLLAATNWIGNIIISSTFLTLLNKAGAPAAFSIYAVICCFGLIFIYFCYPETKGIGLDQIDQLFEGGGFGVKKANEMRLKGKLSKFKRSDDFFQSNL